MNEYVLVMFDKSREVTIDGNASGYSTGDVIELEAGLHIISLEGPQSFSPLEENINPSGTSPLKPLKVYFSEIK
jgi:hypothetical protein